MHLSEIINHLGEEREHYFHAVAPPLIQSSNFTFENLEKFRTAIAAEAVHHIYTRGNNPTVAILRKKLAALEGTEDALVFASGAGATASALLSLLQSGDHIVCVKNPYSWTKALISNLLPQFDINYTFADGTDHRCLEAAIQPNTRLLYLESPNSLTYELQDLQACAAIARPRNIITIIDNSNCTPIFQQPAQFGIDLVMHTGTKYLNGHSDAVNGIICGSSHLIDRIFQSGVMTLGNIISPHDAWLILRGLRTLELRLRRSFESALKIAAWLEQHPRIEKVLFPFLPSFPQYHLACRQMSGCAGLITLYLKASDITAVEAFTESLRRFLLAVSWGGYESLMLPMAAFYRVPGKSTPQHPFTMIRLYIGLEDPDWLISDLEQALNTL